MNTIAKIVYGAFAAMALLWSVNASAGAVEGFKFMEKQACAACHNITGEVSAKTVGLWRKGPALYYAGDKYNQNWIESWLQKPTRIRPSGEFYLDHTQTGVKWNTLRHDSLKPHVKLAALDARNVALALTELRAKDALVNVEHYNADMTVPSGLGDMMFDKVNGCLACHSIEPNYGGLSGPELYTAAARLKPEYMLSYIRNPQAWNHKSWMPRRELSEEDMQKTVNYIISLASDKTKALMKSDVDQSAAKDYRVYCMQCHGISGTGSGINSRDMEVPPRNHSDSKYLRTRTDAELFKAIKEGGSSVSKSALMPPWGRVLSDGEIKGLVKHIRKLCNCKFDSSKSKQ
ncbi:MAG: c-type cytochrome [Mariprofundaceae bacterium]|nr:c-type cytochrome [Mariprofundaceae bacterium]